MVLLIQDPLTAQKLLEQRRASGNDRWDEVWDGTYIFMPNPNIEHQGITGRLLMALGQVVEWPGLGKVFPGVNVSDRDDDWTQNYRCPDVAVYHVGNPAVPKGAYWYGGPDFAVEIISPDDRSREKFEFYAKAGVRELLFIDRDPWALELYQCRESAWVPAGRSTVNDSVVLASSTLPLRFRLLPGEARPLIEVTAADESQPWMV